MFAGYSYLDSELVDAGKAGRNGNVNASAASNNGNEDAKYAEEQLQSLDHL